ncbi:MAG: bifunctional phosphoglucose/phosphomannose isomerase [Candidatus Doudnabacteria bacterium]|nr:bifunctional phosphoglucose/phosphomannose isomerase [Candidatus Doudnabacteria bacterium]
MATQDLDSLTPPLELDSQDMLTSIGMLPDQMKHAWESVSQISLPEDYRNVDRLVVFGMGGSALGTDILQHLYAKQLKVPVTIVNDYHVPGFVDERTLVLLSSYSGSTEEVVTAGKEVMGRGSKVLVIATGKDLASLAEEHSLPIYHIDPTYNPCGQPRIAVGYSVVGQLAFFSRLGLIPLTEQELTDTIAFLRDLIPTYGPETPESDNSAKQLARTLSTKVPVLSSSEHLQGIAHVMRNQLNENGKHMSALLPVPEMNHHAMEGLAHPGSVKDLHFLLFPSSLYFERTQKRYEVIELILEKQGISFDRVDVPGATPLQQAFALLLIGGYVGFYLAMLNGIDPSPIPWVDLFKSELGK